MILDRAIMSTVAAVPATNSMTVSSMPFVELCSQLAPIAAVAVCASPIPTIQSIARDRNVGQMPLLPYTSMISNAFLWMVYGILLNQSKIWSCNAVGFVLGLVYFSIFTKYSPKAAPSLPGSVRQHKRTILAITFATLVAATSPFFKNPASFIGSTGVLFAILLFASPLSAMKNVLETRDARSIPLPFALVSCVNCFCWTVSGWFQMKDINVYLPNFLGLLCSLLQVALKLVLGNGPHGKSRAAVDLPM